MPHLEQELSALSLDIAARKLSLKRAVEHFSDHLVQGGFTEGTYENIMEARRAELKEFNRLLDKVRWSVPKRLIKKIDAFTEAMLMANDLRVELVAYAHAKSPIDTYQDAQNHVPVEILTGFKQAHEDTIKANHDLVRHLLLQKTIAEQFKDMKFTSRLIAVLHSFILDPFAADKMHAVLDSIIKLEKIEAQDKQKSITGTTLRIVGWSIIIFATVIAINPAVGLTIVAISIGLTIVGELINLLGKRLQKPLICQEQLFSLHNSMLLFKRNVPVVEAKNEANIQPSRNGILKLSLLEKTKTM